MCNMYSILQNLCAQKGITITEMCREAGVPRSSVGNLATGSTQQLSAKNMQKLATYFNVSADYLLGNEEKPAPKNRNGLSIKEQKDIAKKVDAFMASLENEKDLMFDGDPASDEALEDLRRAITVGYEMARIKNREKYNPYKNKNKK